MSSQPDADAFLKSILANPAEVTTRLAFADWLEETGGVSNLAWAYFIRLNAEIATHLSCGTWRTGVEEEAASHAPYIRATLTIPATSLVAHRNAVRHLLPLSHFTVVLAGFEIPPAVLELMPESVARENLVLPLDLQGSTLVVTTTEANDDTRQKLTFILNRDIVLVRGHADDILAAITYNFGEHEYESIDSEPLPPRVR